MNWRRLLGLCEHDWDTRFWGGYTHGVLCVKCGKIEYRKGRSPQPMPLGTSFGWCHEQQDRDGDGLP